MIVDPSSLNKKTSNPKQNKGLHSCLAVKAVHIEVIRDLSRDAFLAAHKGVIARREICTDIYTDNDSNVVG